MNLFRLLTFFMLFPVFLPAVRADEGFWLPLYIGRNINDMKVRGLKLQEDDLYSTNHASFKDAVVQIGLGHTGTVVSPRGLLITSYECGYPYINALSDAKHDYREKGFWAKNRLEEIPCPGLTATFLIRMDNVTSEALVGVSPQMSIEEREALIAQNIANIVYLATNNTSYEATVEPFWGGHEYYVFITQTFTDVRLVGAPPRSLGDFGGDTDNWQWPRHAADFSIFRIYADENNQPVYEDQYNVPYKSPKFFPISLSGYREGDFTMMLGYPGPTRNNMPSAGVRMIRDMMNPHKANIRRLRLSVLTALADTAQSSRQLMLYKYSVAKNFYDKGLAENEGLWKLRIVEQRATEEKDFFEWVQQNSAMKQEFEFLFENYEKLYRDLAPYRLALEYFNEIMSAVEIIDLARKCEILLELSYLSIPPMEKQYILTRATGQLRREAIYFFKTWQPELDKRMMAEMLTLFRDSIEPYFHPTVFQQISEKPYMGDIQKYVDDVFAQSVIANPKLFYPLLIKYDLSVSPARLRQDPLFQLYKSFDIKEWAKIRPEYFRVKDQIEALDRLYYRGRLSRDDDKNIYPDGNGTMRLAYGTVTAYAPRDAVYFKHFTTLRGLIEKNFRSENGLDYRLPDSIVALYNSRNYGNYSVNGQMQVSFLTNMHSTAGFSGSPVMDGEGGLIGIYSNRIREGLITDYYYVDSRSRSIVIDIRFVLFIIDKFAHSRYILDELMVKQDDF